MATTTSLLTAEQYFELPDPGYPTELIRGEIVMMMVPGYDHGLICNRIGRFVGNFADEHELGTVTNNDSGVVTERDPDSVRGPDVAYYSYQRMPKGKSCRSYPAAVPELVFEVKSPSDAWKKVHAKTAQYLNAGVTTVCVVDPESETVMAHHAEKAPNEFGIDDTLALPDTLPGFSLPVRKIFHA